MNLPTKPNPSAERARAHLHLCPPTNATATNAKCASSCAGESSTGGNGSRNGSPEWQKLVESKWLKNSTPKQQANGSEATAATPATGGKHCTRCAVGQGRRNCECFELMTFDRVAMRFVLGGLALFWIVAIGGVALKGCAS